MGGALEEYTEDRASKGQDRLKQVSAKASVCTLCSIGLDFSFTLFLRSLAPNGRKKKLREKRRMKSQKLS